MSTDSSSNRRPGNWRKIPPPAAQLDDALYASAETLRIAVALLHPVLPESTANIWAQLGMTQPIESLEIAKLAWGQLLPEQKIGMIAPVFPRIEAKSAIERMRALEEEETARQAKLLGKLPRPAVDRGRCNRHPAAVAEGRYRRLRQS